MHYLAQMNVPFFPGSIAVVLPVLILITLWSVILKGFALWYAARGGQKWWFIALLVINTIGILEIVYLIWFGPKFLRKTKTPTNGSSPQ